MQDQFLRVVLVAALAGWATLSVGQTGTPQRGYPIAPTGQRACYDTANREITCPARNAALGGQDAADERAALRYRDNGDGTVSDLNTGLIWQQATGAKRTWDEAVEGARSLRLAGHDDWRLPSIKELYSLIDFAGATPAPGQVGKPYIDTRYFDFRYGDTRAAERPIDAQYWSATPYVGRTMLHDASVFGVNFADGRIKAYPKARPLRGPHRMFVRYVRGNPDYGRNDFVDNGDGTVSDRATGLMWMQADSGAFKAGPAHDGRMDWAEALAWAAATRFAGHGDWRLPNAKELQSLVDYTRAPQTDGGPAMSPLFRATAIRDERGRSNYPAYWTSTTHLDGPRGGDSAVYIAFGEALGYMRFPRSGGEPLLVDVHGAGAQRSDPKQGDPRAFPRGRGPQGDVIRIYNFARLVRGGR